MRRRHRIALLCLALLAPSSMTARAQQPRPEAALAAQRDQLIRDGRQALADLQPEARTLPPRLLSEVVRFELGRTDHLETSLVLPEKAGEYVVPMEDVGGAVSRARVSVAEVEAGSNVLHMNLALLRLDEKAARMTSVQVLPAPINMTLAVTTETPGSTVMAQLIVQRVSIGLDDDIMPGNATLYLTREREDADDSSETVQLQAATFGELVRAHHDEVLASLGEGLVLLRAMPLLAGVSEDAARAALASDRSVSPEVERQVDAMLAELSKTGSASIPSLRVRLRRLGPAAISSLAQRSREQWSVDLALNADTLLAGLTPINSKDAAALLASPTRLVDLLYSSDEWVRRESLARLQKFARRPLPIDPARDPYAIADAIETVRNEVAPSR